jgi:hypothetical protein
MSNHLQPQRLVHGAQRKTQLDATTVATKDAIAQRWANLHAQLKSGMDDIKADIATTQAEHEAARAQRKAERAEDNAAAAIAFAYDAIDYAEPAVLDAVIARTDADAYAV